MGQRSLPVLCWRWRNIMKISVMAVGKIKSRHIKALADDYASRLSRYILAEISVVRNDAKALEKIAPSDFVIVLDERGKEMTSKNLAEFLTGHQARGTKNMVIFIGGPDGTDEQLKMRANFILSLSNMTLPHELAQAVLLEQLYRACSINRGEPYHRE